MIVTSQIAYAEEPSLPLAAFLALVQRVWPGDFSRSGTETAIRQTINFTARSECCLVGCVRVMTDGYFFAVVTEILVAPEFQRRGIGAELMRRAFDASPCTLSFGV